MIDIPSGKQKNHRFALYIAVSSMCFFILIIGERYLIGWVLSIIFTASLYFANRGILKTKYASASVLFAVILVTINIAYSFGRPYPSIQGLFISSHEKISTAHKGNIARTMDEDQIYNYVVKQREALQKDISSYTVPKNINVTRILINQIPAEWVSPADAPDDKAIIYLHGGGYITGNLETSRPFAIRLAQSTGLKVLVVEYALAPEYPYPAALNQSSQVYDWLINQGMKSSRITIVGDSAGGGLSLATAFLLRENSRPLPAALVLISPWLDLTLDSEANKVLKRKDGMDWYNQNARLYAGNEDAHTPGISPIYGNFSGLPPVLIHAGSADILVYDIKKAAEIARAAGTDVDLKVFEGMYHDFTTIAAYIPESQVSLNGISEFIKSHVE